MQIAAYARLPLFWARWRRNEHTRNSLHTENSASRESDRKEVLNGKVVSSAAVRKKRKVASYNATGCMSPLGIYPAFTRVPRSGWHLRTRGRRGLRRAFKRTYIFRNEFTTGHIYGHINSMSRRKRREFCGSSSASELPRTWLPFEETPKAEPAPFICCEFFRQGLRPQKDAVSSLSDIPTLLAFDPVPTPTATFEIP